MGVLVMWQGPLILVAVTKGDKRQHLLIGPDDASEIAEELGKRLRESVE